MDAQMKTQEMTSTFPVWDVKLVDGEVPIIQGDTEDIQTALMATVLELGTIPNLPNAGVPWTDFLTGKIVFGELDSYIRESMNNAGMNRFVPDYQIIDDQLYVNVKREGT